MLLLLSMNYLESLNERQREAVLHTEGPVLILAGAGAGKTKTVTFRILHLIKKGIAPHNILAITFTNKAAKEMQERVEHLLTEDKTLNLSSEFPERPFLSTFHSLGVHILKENSKLLGLPRHFAIFDRNDSKRAVKEAVIASNLDPKQFDPGKILNAISREKGNFVTYEDFQAKVGNNYMQKITADVWGRYEATMRDEKALDFDDLLLKTALLLKRNPDVLKRLQDRWQYIHIDEYQDTNKVQYEIAKLLGDAHKNMCVVGDIDQNIYSWRGADIKNILSFEKDYPNAKVILLEENYRSTQVILNAANKVIEKNKNRRDKKLFTKNNEGEKIGMFIAYDENDEARFIADTAKRLVEKGISPRDIAVLYRANYQSRALEEAFLYEKVPYQVLGTRFFERKEVKDVLSYIRAALNPDNMGDVKRVINTPVRGIGKVTILKVAEGKVSELPAATRAKVEAFFGMLARIKDECEREKPSHVIKFIMKLTGLEAELLADGTEGEERLENIRELVTLATKYDAMPQGEGIEQLLTDAALASDQDELQKDHNAVKLMTVHASKGLEFEHVFISGLEEGLFPHERLGEVKEDNEEERRLFYVAVTRARKKLYLTCAGMRTIFGNRQITIPSQFLSDIDDEYLEKEERQIARGVKEIFIDF